MERRARGRADAAGRRRAGGVRGRPARAAPTAGGCCSWPARATTAATRCTPARCSPGAARGSRWSRSPTRSTRPGWPPCARSEAGVVELAAVSTPDVVLDGIVGIGGRPGLRDRAAAARPSRRGRPMVAVDVPSGVDVDTGRVDGDHVRADLTVTFGTHKVCHLVEPAASACGVVQLVDIGLDLPDAAVTALQQDDVAALLPRPGEDAQKYTRGVVGVRAGSAALPGGRGALDLRRRVRAGRHGAVRRWGTRRGPGRPSRGGRRRGAGPGLGGRLRRRRGRGRVADRGACATAYPSSSTPTPSSTSTPPLGPPRPADARTPASSPRCSGVERAEVEADQLAFARRAATEYAATVLLKGHHTLVAAPDGRVRVTTTGTPWLAVAGAGDVLGGLCGALLAAGLTPYDAGSVGAWLHGAAATYASGGGPLSAPRVAAALPRVVAALLPIVRSIWHARHAGQAMTECRERTGRAPRWGRRWEDARMSAEARRPEIVVDLGAIRRNVGRLRDLVAPDGSDVMVVVKADGYGHGMVESAAAARRAGAPWLGVATIEEALRLRAAGDTGRLLCWLTVPGDDWAAAIERDVDVTAYSVAELDEIRAAVDGVGGRAAPARRPAQGRHRALARRLDRRAVARRAGGGPRRRGRRRLAGHRHLVALRLQRRARPSRERRPGARLPRRPGRRRGGGPAAGGAPPGQLRRRASCGPSSRFDLVRCGIASYGLDPAPGLSPDLGLEPAMTVTAPLALTKDLHAGAAVSYGHTWTAPGATRVGLVPLGYGDGVPRHAGNTAEVWVDGKRRPIRGRICMDQFVVDLDGDAGRGGRRGRALRARYVGRADRRRLGAGLRHHPLRDRHPHGRATAPPLRRSRPVSTHAQGPVGRRRARGGSGRSRGRRHGVPAGPAPPGHQPARGRRRHAVRLAALAADHGGHRRRRRPPRRGRRATPRRPAPRGRRRRSSRSSSSTATP